MKSKIEVRTIGFEMRVLEREKKPVIEGYAAVFNSQSQDIGGLVEIIKPGAFKKSIDRGDDVKASIEHGRGLAIIGRTKSGTLRLAEDSRGLHVEIHPPDTMAGRDAVELLRRGDIDQMSFSFETITDNLRMEGGELVRELIEVNLRDVAITSNPAYLQTSAEVRSMDELKADLMARIGTAGMIPIAQLEYEIEVLSL